jgi:hypothetical protein
MPKESWIKRWLSYWWDNARVANERYNDMTLIVVLVIFFGSAIWGAVLKTSDNSPAWGPLPANAAGNILLTIAVLVGLWCLLVLPFLRHEKIQLELDGFKQGEDQERLRRARKDLLGGLLMALESRKREVWSMPYVLFDNDHSSKEITITNHDITRVLKFLNANLGKDCAALFMASVGSPPDEPTGVDDAAMLQWRRNRHIHALECHISELKGIIQRYQSQ